MQKILFVVFLLATTLLCANTVTAQITSDDANQQGKTSFGDDFYIFCSTAKGESNGSLMASSSFGNAIFSWVVYDTITNSFAPYNGAEQTDTLQSYIYDLGDGCYRVTINAGGNVADYQAWVLNDWITVTKTEIPDSTSLCKGFKILADFIYAPLNVYNTQTGEKSTVRNNSGFYSTWYLGDEAIAWELNGYVSPPVASNTPLQYTLVVGDAFGCTGEGMVEYYSKVPKSVFTYDPPDEEEAVAEITFNNNSVNYDSTYWLFYKEATQIAYEIEENNGEPVDSIDFILTDDAPVYQYKLAGEYFVKLVTVKVNETGNCYDTLKSSSIVVSDTLIVVPNFFTPNGDGINDNFIVKTQSLKSMNIRIFNRWGGLVHSWKYSNITSSDYVYEHSVWDGRIGNRMASPGVYYYIIQYEGRKIDYSGRKERNVKGTKKGFIHLFRDRN